ncbi:5-formyltetrahydrofolate cyclo-ligase [Cupriavidus sp. AU9028]|uniref:5-formyltetrahydrofolate cyclo-ligase n=1 Tax=Cupriavidus sp. AU9028 TaxID=2871157 RepID=UPI001C962895|nr:5-formyltetrahydrofolate cyclo-ligase [Cupriavidus sp. AU9028]MBY4896656.1 5-formyltetrahydrofolate cyclo-ligase [Cupriavidus sp. AU9028]
MPAGTSEKPVVSGECPARAGTVGTPEPPPARPALRKQLLALRASQPARAERDARIASLLAELLDRLPVHCLGFYWPIQYEFDARRVVSDWLGAAPGRTAALPVVAQPAAPLDFHLWTPDVPMREGRYGIPVPDGTDAVQPDALLIPCVGFSSDKFRLGYGGGFYDRTLAALPQRPLAIGIGYEACRLTLEVEEHDVPMDWLVTEAGAA